MKILTDCRNVRPGQKVSFMYNKKERIGHVTEVDKAIFTVDHENPSLYDDKRFSSYKFMRLDSRITLV